MKKVWIFSGVLLATLAACDRNTVPANDVSSTPPPATAPADAADETVDAPPADGIVDRDGKPVAVVDFDITSVPASTQALGALPFFGLPAGYEPINKAHLREWARFPVRLDGGIHWVEGRSWSAQIGTSSSSGKTFSGLELQRNLDNLITAAGGRKVFEGPLQRAIYYGPQLEDEIGGGFIEVVNREQDAPTTVYVIRQAERTIWLQLSTDSSSAGLLVMETIPFKPSAHWSNDFPHLTLPAGYTDRNKPKLRDFDRFPFWNGNDFEQIEGRTWSADFGKEEQAFSMHEVRRNLQAMMESVNGTRVFAGRIPREKAEAVPKDVQAAYSEGASLGWDDYDLEVWRADLSDGRQVWVHARLEYLQAGWVVVERKGFTQSATLLPADALKQQLDSAGKVAIQVNFATDKATILPDSQPQIDQVLALLKQGATLKLMVEGHTDNSGGAEHNQRLSEQRANAVMSTLVGAGIDASRLQASGLGQSKPVADNATDAGRASNRRVELIKR